MVSAAGVRRLGAPQRFEVKPVPNAVPGTDYVAVAAFQYQTSELMRKISAAGAEIDRAEERLRHLRAALVQTPRADLGLSVPMDSLARTLAALDLQLRGDPARRRLNESAVPSIQSRP